MSRYAAVALVLQARGEAHPLVCDNAAIDEMGVVGYLGVPLTPSDSQTLGSLCAITRSPRVWTLQDEATLRDPSVMVEGLPTRGVVILDHMLEGAVALDRQWRITLANRVAARLTRRSRSQSVG